MREDLVDPKRAELFTHLLVTDQPPPADLTPHERKFWDSLADEIREMKAQGITVMIPWEP